MKTVEYVWCSGCMKRGFGSFEQARKALGHAQTKRKRRADARGSRKGLDMETRVYECDEGLWHLTGQARAKETRPQSITYLEHVA